MYKCFIRSVLPPICENVGFPQFRRQKSQTDAGMCSIRPQRTPSGRLGGKRHRNVPLDVRGYAQYSGHMTATTPSNAAHDDSDDAVRIVDDRSRGAFVLLVNGEEAGHIAYSTTVPDPDAASSTDAPSAIDLTHTEVDEAFAGQGLAGRLVRGALTALQNRQPAVKVTASCPYAAKWIERHPEEFTSLIAG